LAKPSLDFPARNELSLTPLQLLGLVVKAILEDRASDAEVDQVRRVYYRLSTDWYET